MKKSILALAVSMVAAPAFAGGLVAVEAPAVEAAPVVAGAWTGYYVGGQVAYVETEFAGSAADKTYGETYGLFAGYNHQIANYVVGAEVGYADASGLKNANFKGDDLFTAKARLGYDMGAYLPFISAGIARIDGTSAAAGGKFGETGNVFGLGVDYAYSDALVLGAEVSKYDFGNIAANADLEATSVALRAAYKF